MRRPVSTLLCGESVKAVVLGGVVGCVVLPAAPEHAGPGSSEDAYGVGVCAAAGAGSLVDILGPGVPVACAVGEYAHMFAQTLVAGPAEGRVVALAGLDRYWGLSGISGERVVGGVAVAVIADLGDQPGGCEDALAVTEEGEEDRPVRVRADSTGDLAGELADLLDDRAQRGSECDHGGASCVLLEFVDDGGRCAAQLPQQLGGSALAAIGITCEETFEAFLAETTRVGGAWVELEERERDRAVDSGEDLLGAGPECLQLRAELVSERDTRVHEVLSGTNERLQRQRLVAGGREYGESVTVCSSELAQHECVKAVVLARGCAVAVTSCLDLVGVDRQYENVGRQESPDEQPVGPLDRAALDLVTVQQFDQRTDATLVVSELLGSEQHSVLVGDVHVVPVAGPVDPAYCAHVFSSSVEVRLKNAGREVPWRVLIGRPSVGRRPVAALGASHHREALVSFRPSQRQARRALSRRWSAMCAESQASLNQRSSDITLSRKENENNPTTQQPQVVL
jgi:hypothetical protein